jgi:hypothetical protein
MDSIPISIQLVDPNYKEVHAHACTVPTLEEQQLKQSKEIVRFVDI